MTCSDHSNGSESQPDLIKLDTEHQEVRVGGGAGGGVFNNLVAEFDPLLNIPQRGSNDSLFESQTTKTISPMPIPCGSAQQGQGQWGRVVGGASMRRQGSASSATSTSPKNITQVSPRQSLNMADTAVLPSPSIARPRPRAMNLPQVPAPPLPYSAPSSRPHSPRQRRPSPTPSAESMRMYRYDSDSGWNYLSDSDATSTSSSLHDLSLTDDETLMRIPSFDVENFFADY